MGGGPPGLLIFLWNQRFTKIVISEGKMTEEQTANKERPVSFGGLSKTCYPVHNETSWKLLREASNHKIQGASIPENIWKLCKAAKQTLEHWCAWLQSSMEAVHTQKGMDWEWCSCRSWAEFCSFQPRGSTPSSLFYSQCKQARGVPLGLLRAHVLVLFLCSLGFLFTSLTYTGC